MSSPYADVTPLYAVFGGVLAVNLCVAAVLIISGRRKWQRAASEYRCRHFFAMQWRNSGSDVRWEVFQAILSLCGFGVYVSSTYTVGAESMALIAVELTLWLFLIFDIVFQAVLSLSSPRALLQPYNLVDLLLSLLMPVAIVLTVANVADVMRFVRVARAARVLRTYRLVLLLRKGFPRALGSLVFTLLNIVLMFAALVQFLEAQGEPPDWTAPVHLPYHTCVYLIVMTVATVGYGDVAPQTSLARYAIILMVFASIVFIPLRTSALSATLEDDALKSSYDRGNRPGKFVLLTGQQLSSHALRAFLTEFFHKHHANQECDLLLLFPEPPSVGTSVLLADWRWERRVSYLVGSALVDGDLVRAHAAEASAVFVLSHNMRADDPSVDEEVVLQAMSLRRYCRYRPIVAQLQGHSNRVYLSKIVDHIEVVTQLKMAILAKSCAIPGLLAVIYNLISGSAMHERHDLTPWQREYAAGANVDLFTPLAGPHLHGRMLVDVTLEAMRGHGVLVLGIITSTGTRVLHAGRFYRIVNGDRVVVLARSLFNVAFLSRTPTPQKKASELSERVLGDIELASTFTSPIMSMQLSPDAALAGPGHKRPVTARAIARRRGFQFAPRPPASHDASDSRDDAMPVGSDDAIADLDARLAVAESSAQTSQAFGGDPVGGSAAVSEPASVDVPLSVHAPGRPAADDTDAHARSAALRTLLDEVYRGDAAAMARDVATVTGRRVVGQDDARGDSLHVAPSGPLARFRQAARAAASRGDEAASEPSSTVAKWDVRVGSSGDTAAQHRTGSHGGASGPHAGAVGAGGSHGGGSSSGGLQGAGRRVGGRTRDVVEVLASVYSGREHVLVCGMPVGIGTFLRALRECFTSSKAPDIVLLSPVMPESDALSELAAVAGVFVVVGSARRRKDLARAGVLRAFACVVVGAPTSQEQQGAHQQRAELMMDKDTLLTALLVRSLNANLFVITELVQPANVSYLYGGGGGGGARPAGRVRRQSQQELAQWDAESVRLREEFASGRIWSSNTLDTLLAQSFFSPHLLATLQQLVLPDSKQGDARVPPVTLAQVPVRNAHIGQTFADVFAALLDTEDMLALALLRHADAAYAYTLPDPQTRIEDTDRIVVLRRVAAPTAARRSSAPAMPRAD